VRAGLSRASPFAGFSVIDAEGAEAGISAHQVPVGVEGFEGDARLLQLLVMALRDAGPTLAVTRPRPTAAYLAMPDPTRWPGANGPLSEADQQAARRAVPARAAALWANAARCWGGSGALPELREVHATGHTAFHRALSQAARDLRSGAVSAALVGAVDSYIDAEGLARLADTGRLKTPLDPAGLQPGEAAGFVWIEAAERAAPAAGPALATVRALAFAQEEHASFADGAPSGRGTASALHDAAAHLSVSRQLPLWAVSDINGEVFRATDWGNALVHIEAERRIQLAPATMYPAASLGDTGAASGVVALCLAATAFSRGWALAPTAALLSAADSGERSALLIQAA